MPKKKAFDGPLKIVTHLDLASLRMTLAHTAPLGKSRPSGFTVGGKRYTYSNPPPKPGRLRQSFMKKGAVVLSKSGKRILITSDLPYARIQDQGGFIKPHRQPEGRPNMMFKRGGKVVFTRYRGGITIKPKYYVRKAVKKWWTSRGKEIQVRWADHENDQPVVARGSH